MVVSTDCLLLYQTNISVSRTSLVSIIYRNLFYYLCYTGNPISQQLNGKTMIWQAAQRILYAQCTVGRCVNYREILSDNYLDYWCIFLYFLSFILAQGIELLSASFSITIVSEYVRHGCTKYWICSFCLSCKEWDINHYFILRAVTSSMALVDRLQLFISAINSNCFTYAMHGSLPL